VTRVSGIARAAIEAFAGELVAEFRARAASWREFSDQEPGGDERALVREAMYLELAAAIEISARRCVS
jgi:hypothetical protein